MTDTQSVAVPDFRVGAEEAEEASKNVKFNRTEYWGIDDGETDILRFITEHKMLVDPSDPNSPTRAGWIVVNQHNNAKLRPKPDDYKGNWPKGMPVPCRNDRAFKGIFDGCFICDTQVKPGTIKAPQPRVYAYAVRRQEVMKDGVVIGYKTRMKTVAVTGPDGKPTGEEVEVPDVVVVNQSYNNFFNALKAFKDAYGNTILDRDYLVKRVGEGLDTDYKPVPMDPVMVRHPNNEDPDDKTTVKFDLRDEAFLKRFGWETHEAAYASLSKFVFDKANDSTYAYYDPSLPFQVRSTEGGGDAGATTTQTASTEVANEKLAALRSRVVGHGDAATQVGADPAAAGDEAPPAGTEEAAAETPAASAPATEEADFT